LTSLDTPPYRNSQTERAFLIEDIEASTLGRNPISWTKLALAENDRFREEAKSTNNALRDAVDNMQSF
jgi:hypothetical protein